MRSLGTSSTRQRCWRAMNATLTKQFEGFAECCLELARSAETTERRARFIQMADEYRLATLLTSEELSSGPKNRRLLPAAESPLLIAAEAPASRALTRPQPRLFARSAAPRHPGFKKTTFAAIRRRINCNDGRTVKAGLFYVRRHTCADGSFEWYVLNGHTRRPASKLFRTRAGRSGAGEVAGEARAGQGASPQANAVTRTGPQNIASAAPR